MKEREHGDPQSGSVDDLDAEDTGLHQISWFTLNKLEGGS